MSSRPFTTPSSSLLQVVQKDAPWVVRVEQNVCGRTVRLFDSSGDYRAFALAALVRPVNLLTEGEPA